MPKSIVMESVMYDADKRREENLRVKHNILSLNVVFWGGIYRDTDD